MSSADNFLCYTSTPVHKLVNPNPKVPDGEYIILLNGIDLRTRINGENQYFLVHLKVVDDSPQNGLVYEDCFTLRSGYIKESIKQVVQLLRKVNILKYANIHTEHIEAAPYEEDHKKLGELMRVLQNEIIANEILLRVTIKKEMLEINGIKKSYTHVKYTDLIAYNPRTLNPIQGENDLTLDEEDIVTCKSYLVADNVRIEELPR